MAPPDPAAPHLPLFWWGPTLLQVSRRLFRPACPARTRRTDDEIWDQASGSADARSVGADFKIDLLKRLVKLVHNGSGNIHLFLGPDNVLAGEHHVVLLLCRNVADNLKNFTAHLVQGHARRLLEGLTALLDELLDPLNFILVFLPLCLEFFRRQLCAHFYKRLFLLQQVPLQLGKLILECLAVLVDLALNAFRRQGLTHNLLG